ncbi:hypothetical protein HER32_11840 [Hymenobacter sp. BT18]|uniref:hypothetical protein n=1 Tax=Hymenobacter sp. BT18 TaxID=2835648 RepID=UPI00143E81E7|nr:hypothetical protein [Hymenobacter sp. BT18]QIX61833.1 hypothetical protein HER32_11840 [Hymenobacter sp. BT18]
MPTANSHPRTYEQAQDARRRAQLYNRAEGFALLVVVVLVALVVLASCSTTRPAGIRAGKFAQENPEPRINRL